MYMYIYIYIYVYMYVCMYVYVRPCMWCGAVLNLPADLAAAGLLFRVYGVAV